MNIDGRVLVYGAAGHTGRFVVAELLDRGLVPVLAGRSAEPLADVARGHSDLERRVIGLDDADLLRRGIDGVAAVVNCAGPFLDTGLPLARAAVSVGAHYLDVTAEQAAVRALYDELDGPARDAGVAVVPAMAFYGGLADLLVTTLVQDDGRADEVEVAIGLDRWWPTAGTRATGARNTATRLVIRDGNLVPRADPAPTADWDYPPPLGRQDVVELPFSEVITIARHLGVGTLTSYLNTAPLDDLHDAGTPAPTAVDDAGRSAQRFTVDVVVRRAGSTRRATVTGHDIYAVTAPIVVEGAARLLDGRHHGPGALAPGQAFDAAAVLTSLRRRVSDLVLRRDEPGHAPRSGAGRGRRSDRPQPGPRR